MFSWLSIGHSHIGDINSEVRFSCCESGYPRKVHGFSQDSFRGTAFNIKQKVMMVAYLKFSLSLAISKSWKLLTRAVSFFYQY